MTQPAHPWVPCVCDEYWCTDHDEHVSMCACPPIEEWDSSPYCEDGIEHVSH